jgi:hypothetical protein
VVQSVPLEEVLLSLVVIGFKECNE